MLFCFLGQCFIRRWPWFFSDFHAIAVARRVFCIMTHTHTHMHACKFNWVDATCIKFIDVMILFTKIDVLNGLCAMSMCTKAAQITTQKCAKYFGDKQKAHFSPAFPSVFNLVTCLSSEFYCLQHACLPLHQLAYLV